MRCIFINCVYHLFYSGIGINSLCVNETFCVTGSDDGFLRLWPLDFANVYLEAGMSYVDIFSILKNAKNPTIKQTPLKPPPPPHTHTQPTPSLCSKHLRYKPNPFNILKSVHLLDFCEISFKIS